MVDLRVRIINEGDKVVAESRDFAVASKAWDLIDDSLGVKHKVEGEGSLDYEYMRMLRDDRRRLIQEVDEAGDKILNLRERLGEKSRSNNDLRKANAVLQDECSDLREENIEMQDDIRQLSRERDHWEGLAAIYKELASVDEKALQESINADKKIYLDPCRNYDPARYKYGPEHRCKNCEHFVVGNSSRMSLCTLKDTFASPTNPDDTCGHWIPKKRNTCSESDGK